jgi:glycosyltransferase involved in cell wall biosynthesis
MKVAWISTWDRVCGIADYSKELWPVVLKSLEGRSDEGALFSLDKYKTDDDLIKALKEFSPDVVHFQHEYSFFGGKNPPFYTFPNLVARLRKELPKAKFLATGHTVLSDSYRFPMAGRKWQLPLRSLANIFLLKKLREYWGPKTWGVLDGTITHSRHLTDIVKKSGTPYAEVIPLFVPIREKILETPSNEIKTVLVFGFFTYEKGQDVVIEAFKYLKDVPQVRLIFAGGLRLKSDTPYFKKCEKSIKELKLEDRITITGYLQSGELKKYFDKADLVITPFRATSGSASLTSVLAYGLPVLASDLPLNLEIEEREKGCLEFFKSENPEDLARKIRDLIFDKPKLNLMRQGTLRYATSLSPTRVALQHVRVYDNLVK